MPSKKDKNKQKEIIKHNSILNNLLTNIQKGVSNLYKNTYFSPNSNKEDLNTIKTSIDSNIDNLLNNNVSNIGVPNISKLYTRMNDDNLNKNKDKSIVEDIFNDKAISDSFLNTLEQNRMIVEYDEEIDTILKYMPQLEDALEAKKDNVLSADQYSKDYINAINTSNISSLSEFESRIKNLKEHYKLLEFFDTSYDNISKYGEDYIYVVPYKKALAKILNNDTIIKSNESAFLSIAEQAIDSMLQNNNDTAIINLNESTIIDSIGNIEKLDPSYYQDLNGNIELIMSENALLLPALKQKLASIRVLKSVNEAKLNKPIVPNDLDFDSADTTSDGLINVDDTKNNKELSVPGCIVKRLKRENVIPIYIDDICLGYYYIECKSDEVLKGRIGINDPMLGLSTSKLKASDDMTSYNKSLRHISDKISGMIDAKFINANYDLKKEIYAILKHAYSNEATSGTQVTATYISPEDMHHGYFKLDPKTHRGISDLHKSLVPAKMWVSLSTTSAIGTMTRGYDRRVYYVRQNVDTNISQTLLNTINQIKKANFGTREFGSIKNVLNITGRYNDMVMPLNSSGDAPIQFEIMPGQNIDIKTELMDMFEKSAIESTDIPFEYVSSRGQIDFAIRLTMSNGKFLRNCFRRQAKYEPFMSRILTVLYNTEYEENDKIDVKLPAPAFLNIANTSQMIDNVDQYCEKITNMIASASDSDTFRQSVKNKLMKHYLSTYLDMSTIEEISNSSKIESSIEDDKNNSQQ